MINTNNRTDTGGFRKPTGKPKENESGASKVGNSVKKGLQGLGSIALTLAAGATNPNWDGRRVKTNWEKSDEAKNGYSNAYAKTLAKNKTRKVGKSTTFSTKVSTNPNR